MVSLTQRSCLVSHPRGSLSRSLSRRGRRDAGRPAAARAPGRPAAARRAGPRHRRHPCALGACKRGIRGAHTSMPASARPRLARAAARGPGDPLPCTTHLTALTARRPRVVRGAGRGGRARARARARAPALSVHNPLRARAVREPQRIERLPYRPANSSRKTAKQDS